MMQEKTQAKPIALSLEVEELEVFCNPGCNTSSTHPACTCPSRPTTTASLFTAKTVS
jgi:hypothetical protein